MKIIKNTLGNKLFSIFVLIIGICAQIAAQNCCNSVLCEANVDPINDPNDQCLLYDELGDVLVFLDGDSTYRWRYFMENDRVQWDSIPVVNPCTGTGIRGIKRRFICPIPYRVRKNRRRGRGERTVLLAKYYMYNMTQDAVSETNGYTNTDSGNNQEQRGTPNNWYVYTTLSNSNNAEYVLSKQENGNSPLIDKHIPACVPEGINPWTRIDDININVPAPLIAPFGAAVITRDLVRPPVSNGILDIFTISTDGLPTQNDVYRVNNTSGVATLISSVTCNSGVRTSVSYTCPSGSSIWLTTARASLTFDPTTGTWISNAGFTKWGTWCDPVSRPRFRDNICLYGGELPVDGVDVDEDGFVIFR